jgi:hypothetical protein
MDINSKVVTDLLVAIGIVIFKPIKTTVNLGTYDWKSCDGLTIRESESRVPPQKSRQT